MNNKKAALITGSSKRIGKSIALELASIDYSIALHYNTAEKETKEVANEIKDLGSECKIFQCDLSKEEETLLLISRVNKQFRGLELLINNASIYQKSFFLSPLDIFYNHLNVNLISPYILSKEFVKLDNGGQIINIIDTKISKNELGHFAYLLSKKSLADLTKMSARELGPKIRVNGIAPGCILPQKDENPTYITSLVNKLPLKKKGSLKNISNAIRFLIENNYITGQIIFVDGGENL